MKSPEYTATSGNEEIRMISPFHCNNDGRLQYSQYFCTVYWYMYLFMTRSCLRRSLGMLVGLRLALLVVVLMARVSGVGFPVSPT